MSIPFTLDDLLSGIVAPAAVAVVVSWLSRHSVTAESGRQLAASVAFIAGFHAGYWLLRLGPARPESHWQWLPWVLCLTLVAGLPLFISRSVMSVRLGLTVVIAAVSGWLLVPAWDHLQPSPTIHMTVFTGAVVFISTALQPLTVRVPTLWLMGNLTGSLAAGAVILALSGSLRFAQMAGCGVAALMGVITAAIFDKGRVPADGLVFPCTLLIAALMLIGRINSFSDVPLASYLLVPLAPLSLWLAANDRISTPGLRRIFVLSLPLLLCGVAVALAMASEFSFE